MKPLTTLSLAHWKQYIKDPAVLPRRITDWPRFGWIFVLAIFQLTCNSEFCQRNVFTILDLWTPHGKKEKQIKNWLHAEKYQASFLGVDFAYFLSAAVYVSLKVEICMSQDINCDINGTLIPPLIHLKPIYCLARSRGFRYFAKFGGITKKQKPFWLNGYEPLGRES